MSTDADYDKFEKLFCASWSWSRDEKMAEFLKEIGMPEWMIEWDANSHTKMTMKREGNNITTNATMGTGEKQATFNETMQLGVPREVKDKQENPNMVSKFCMSLDGDNMKDNVEPMVPPGKKHTVLTRREGDELISTYTLPGSDVTGTRVFTLDK